MSEPKIRLTQISPSATGTDSISGNVTITNDLTVGGNLTVSGDTTTLNVQTLLVEDNEIILNSNVTGSPSLNASVTVNRGSSSNAFLLWNEGTDKWGWSDDGNTVTEFATAVLKTGDTMTGLLNVASDLVVTGNVGIGTASPSAKLSVDGSVVFNESGADVDFRVESDTVENALFVQGSDGYVGVGTNAPSYPFHVVGSGDTVAAVTGGATSVAALNLGNSTNLADGGIRYDNNTDALIFRANNGEKARIDAAGNFGLGVTPSAWGSGNKAFDIGSYGAVVQGSTVFNVAYNYYFDGSNPVYKNNGIASFYQQSSSGHLWYNAPSGTAGNNITFTQAMTLDASGNLLVGATTGLGTNRRELVLQSANGSILNLGINGATDSFQLVCDSGPNALIINKSNTPMVFYTNNTERARITSGGDLLYGKQVNDVGTTGIALRAIGKITSTMTESTAAEETLVVYTSGASAYRFYVTMGGTVFATSTTISAISDQRYKENIRDLDVGLDAIMALKPRKFDWKEGKGANIKDARGFIAQEFEQVFPDLIDTWKDPAPEGEEPYKSVRQDLIPVLVKAIQELKAELDEAKAKIAALESK